MAEATHLEHELNGELTHLFKPYNWFKSLSEREIVFFPFLCLGDMADYFVPRRSYISFLADQGLGYRVIQIPVTATFVDLERILKEEYPKLTVCSMNLYTSTSTTPGNLLHLMQIPGLQTQVIDTFKRVNGIIYIKPNATLRTTTYIP